MGERGGGLGLAAESGDELRVAGVALVQHLEGDPPGKFKILGQPDVGHSAGTDQVLDPVPVVDDHSFAESHSKPFRIPRTFAVGVASPVTGRLTVKQGLHY